MGVQPMCSVGEMKGDVDSGGAMKGLALSSNFWEVTEKRI